MNPLLSAITDFFAAAAEERRALADLHRRSDGKAQLITVTAGAPALPAKDDGPFISCIHRDTDAFMGDGKLANAIPCKFHGVKAGVTCPDEGFTEAPEDASAIGMVLAEQLDEAKAELDAALKVPEEKTVVSTAAAVEEKGGITFYDNSKAEPSAPPIPDLQCTVPPC